MGNRQKNGSMFIDRELIRSPAYLSLTGIAPQVYLLFRSRAQVNRLKTKRGERERWEIINNGEIVFTYLDALKKHGITGPRFTRAIDQLVRKGFLDIVHQGGGLEGDHQQKRARFGPFCPS